MKPSIYPQIRKVWNSIELENISGDLTQQLELQRRLLDFVHVGNFYYYVFDIKNAVFSFASHEIKSVLGIDPEELTIERYISLVHPDDHPLLLNFEAAAVEFFQNLPPEKVLKYKFSYDIRLRKPDGSYFRLLQQTMTLSSDAENNSLHALGIHTDITHIKPVGPSTLSFIGFDGEPSFYNVDVKNRYTQSPELFTRREKEIVRLLVEGLQSAEISELLNISKHTVETHRKNILKKTGAKTTVELVVKVINGGLI